jgi:hypothetical protein
VVETPTAPPAQETPTPAPQEAEATPTPTPQEEAATPTPTPQEAQATRTRSITVVPAATATPTPTPTPTLQATPTPTPTELPTNWDLARDVIGMWEYVDQEWRYYFDFFSDGRVVVSSNGLRDYEVRDARTLVIQMPEGEWEIGVADLTPDRLVLEGVIDEASEFQRVQGIPDLSSRIVALWLDVTGEFPSLEFAENGVVVGEFGRGVYQVVSDNSVLIECDNTEYCSYYLEFGQEEDAPLVLRVFEIVDDQLTLQGLGYSQPWTLAYREGLPNLAGGIVGRWVDDWDSSVEFTEGGDWIMDDDLYGRYEVVSDSTLWVEIEGSGQGLVVTELTATRLTYAEWGYFYEEDLWVYTRE